MEYFGKNIRKLRIKFWQNYILWYQNRSNECLVKWNKVKKKDPLLNKFIKKVFKLKTKNDSNDISVKFICAMYLPNYEKKSF